MISFRHLLALGATVLVAACASDPLSMIPAGERAAIMTAPPAAGRATAGAVDRDELRALARRGRGNADRPTPATDLDVRQLPLVLQFAAGDDQISDRDAARIAAWADDVKGSGNLVLVSGSDGLASAALAARRARAVGKALPEGATLRVRFDAGTAANTARLRVESRRETAGAP